MKKSTRLCVALGIWIAVGICGCSSQNPQQNPVAHETVVSTPVSTSTLAPVVTTGTAAAVSPTPAPKPKLHLDFLEKAKDFAYANEYGSALKPLGEAYKLAPNDPDVNLWLFICHKNLGPASTKSKAYFFAKRVVSLMPEALAAEQAHAYIKEASSNPRPTAVSVQSRNTQNSQVSDGFGRLGPTYLSKLSQHYAKLSYSDFEEASANTQTAIGEAKRGNPGDVVRFLGETLPILKQAEETWVGYTATGLSSGDLSEADKYVAELRLIKLVRAETELVLGLAHLKSGSTSDARKFLNMAASDKGLDDDWSGKSEYLEVRRVARAEAGGI